MELSAHIEGGWQEPDDKGRRLCRSSFNLGWFDELRIIPSVIFDVGSFDGADAIRFKRAYPDATVVAIDADPLRAEAIRKNVENEDVIVIEAAVVDRVGAINLHHAGDRSERGSRCASVFQWPKKPFQEAVTVEATTIHAVCRRLQLEAIDLLHMDIEGAELLAIQGLGDIRPALIWAEIWDGWIGAPGSEKTHEAIIALGYEQIAASKADRLYLRR